MTMRRDYMNSLGKTKLSNRILPILFLSLESSEIWTEGDKGSELT